jgi:histidyl-tRNA synthetase
LMQEYGVEAIEQADVYLVNVGELAEAKALAISERLRDAGLAVVMHAGGGSFKSQMKKADRSKARYAMIIGDDEIQSDQVSLKPMLSAGEQQKLTLESAVQLLKHD